VGLGILLALLGIWVTVSDCRQHRIPNLGLMVATAGILLWRGISGDLGPALIGGGILTLLGTPLALWTSIGGGDLKYGVLLGVAMGTVEASAAWALAAVAMLTWRGVQAIGCSRRIPAKVILGPWLATASVSVALMAHWRVGL